MLIKFDYTKALRQASEIESAAGELEQLRRHSLGESIDALPKVWTGEAATLYRQNLELLASELEAEARRLRGIAQSIRQTAKRMYAAEQMAKRAVGRGSAAPGGED